MRFLLAASLLVVSSAGLIGKVSTIAPEENELGLRVTFSVVNEGQEDVAVFPWEIAAEGMPWANGLTSDIFAIEDVATGEAVEYVGMIARRLITNESAMLLGVGDVVSTELDLSLDYAFQNPGQYSVRWRGGEEKIIVNVDKPLGDRRFGPNTMFRPTPVSCNSQQSNIVTQTHGAANTQMNRALSNLNSGTTNLFRTWFGTGNRGTVTNCFNNCRSRANNAYRMNCAGSGCPANTYAYVYPGDTTFTVYLCSVFWSRPSERAETLVHELSHFNSVCRTQDYAYGRGPCQALARNNPARAIANADNICFFGADA